MERKGKMSSLARSQNAGERKENAGGRAGTWGTICIAAYHVAALVQRRSTVPLFRLLIDDSRSLLQMHWWVIDAAITPCSRNFLTSVPSARDGPCNGLESPQPQVIAQDESSTDAKPGVQQPIQLLRFTRTSRLSRNAISLFF
jgi:hypothetical protein